MSTAVFLCSQQKEAVCDPKLEKLKALCDEQHHRDYIHSFAEEPNSVECTGHYYLHGLHCCNAGCHKALVGHAKPDTVTQFRPSNKTPVHFCQRCKERWNNGLETDIYVLCHPCFAELQRTKKSPIKIRERKPVVRFNSLDEVTRNLTSPRSKTSKRKSQKTTPGGGSKGAKRARHQVS